MKISMWSIIRADLTIRPSTISARVTRRGEYLLLLNNDTEVISPFWIREMVGFCQREDTGSRGSETLLSRRPGPALRGWGYCQLCRSQNFHTSQDAGYFGRLLRPCRISAP